MNRLLSSLLVALFVAQGSAIAMADDTPAPTATASVDCMAVETNYQPPYRGYEMSGDDKSAKFYLPEGECYFQQHDWANAIAAYSKIGNDLISDYNVDVVYRYHLALAYKAIGDVKNYHKFLFDADADVSAAPVVGQSVDPRFAKMVTDAYKNSGVAAAVDKKVTHDMRVEQWNREQWARKHGYSADEISLVKYRGQPCNISTYERGDDQWVTFWYCNADNVQYESYTFLNGKQHDHFDGGTP
jgi:tetratricopeptide (TPR) repeat protein